MISAGGPDLDAKTVDEPVRCVLTRDHQALVESFFFNMAHTKNDDEKMCKDLGEPVVTIAGKGMIGLVETEPLVIGQQSNAAARPVGEPVPTIAGAGKVALVEPVLINMKGQSSARSVDDPTFTQTTKVHQFLAEAYIVKFYGNGENADSVEDPLATVTAKDRFGLMHSFDECGPGHPVQDAATARAGGSDEF
jgi:DNA (cytosine-5)-methyltransferase 1